MLSGAVDVLVIATLPEELDALLAVSSGVRDAWTRSPDGPHHTAVLDGHGGPLRVVSTRLTKMAATEAADAAATLYERIRPRCLAMCGVCAGHPEDTDLGDVVIGERLLQYDEGKQTTDGFRGDLHIDSMSRDWLRAAQDQAGPATGLHGYCDPADEDWKWWFLERLLTERDPLRSTALRRYIPDALRQPRIELLEKQRLLTIKSERCALTARGRRAIERQRVLAGTHATALPFHVHVGPMCSGNAVVADGAIWRRLSAGGVRKAIAVEMEAAAIGRVARAREIPFVVAKGVMDHGDRHKTDRFKPFAARASAEVLCRFLRSEEVSRTLAPSASSTGEHRARGQRTAEVLGPPPARDGAADGAPADNPFHIAGTMPPDAPSYVRRACDDALAAALRDSPLIVVEGEYQVGKSSLSTRACTALDATHRCCFIDCGLYGTHDVRVFMKSFFRGLSKALERPVDDWSELNGPDEPPLALIVDELGTPTPGIAQQLFPPLFHLTRARPQVRVIYVRPTQASDPSIDRWLAGLGVAHPKYRGPWRSVVVPRFGAADINRLLELLPPRARALAHTDELLRRSGGLPVAVQRVCSALFDAAVGRASEPQLREILAAQESHAR